MAPVKERKRGVAHRTPTLADVAREAGVGTTTVSRVLNGAHYVHAETLQRIQEAIKRLGYRPSHAARALKGERSHTLGLIVPSLADSFFAELADSIQNSARADNYVVLILASGDDVERQIEVLETLRSHRVDGALLTPPRIQSRKFLSAVADLRVPTVAIDRPLERKSAAVVCNNFAASFAATEHLLQHGRRSILFAGGDPALYTIQERARGYRQAMAQAGLPADVLNSAVEPSIRAELRERLSRRKQNRPDAIFGSLNIATQAAFSELTKIGLSVPDDVALIGYDDFPSSELLAPPVSVIRQPVAELGSSSLRLLLEQIKAGARSAATLVLEAKFIPRTSCGCLEHTVAAD